MRGRQQATTISLLFDKATFALTNVNVVGRNKAGTMSQKREEFATPKRTTGPEKDVDNCTSDFEPLEVSLTQELGNVSSWIQKLVIL